MKYPYKVKFTSSAEITVMASSADEAKTEAWSYRGLTDELEANADIEYVVEVNGYGIPTEEEHRSWRVKDEREYHDK